MKFIEVFGRMSDRMTRRPLLVDTDGATIISKGYRGLSTETKPTGVPIDSEYWERDTNKIYRTYDGTNWTFIRGTGAYLATKTSTSPLTTGNLFTYKGSVAIVSITGTITTAIQLQVTNCKLNITPDALAAYDICANKDISNMGVGTLFSITGTAANAMVGTTVVGAIAPGQASIVQATCITSGVVSVTYGAASTGVIKWDIVWEPLNAGASVVAA